MSDVSSLVIRLDRNRSRSDDAVAVRGPGFLFFYSPLLWFVFFFLFLCESPSHPLSGHCALSPICVFASSCAHTAGPIKTPIFGGSIRASAAGGRWLPLPLCRTSPPTKLCCLRPMKEHPHDSLPPHSPFLVRPVCLFVPLCLLTSLPAMASTVSSAVPTSTRLSHSFFPDVLSSSTPPALPPLSRRCSVSNVSLLCPLIFVTTPVDAAKTRLIPFDHCFVCTVIGFVTPSFPL